ncbi:hypothetical protein D3C71_1473310 [compost metagenome]
MGYKYIVHDQGIGKAAALVPNTGLVVEDVVENLIIRGVLQPDPASVRLTKSIAIEFRSPGISGNFNTVGRASNRRAGNFAMDCTVSDNCGYPAAC